MWSSQMHEALVKVDMHLVVTKQYPPHWIGPKVSNGSRVKQRPLGSSRMLGDRSL